MRTKMKDLGQQIVELSNKFDEPSSMVNEPIKNNKLNPRQYKQMINYLVRNKNKDSIDERRVPLKKKSDTKVPPKIAKSKEDLEDEFEVIEVPILMREYELFLENNTGKNFKDFLKEQKLLNISDYFRLGATVAERTPYERELVTELVKKTFSKSSTDN